MNNPITDLVIKHAYDTEPKIISLRNSRHESVGALYLETLRNEIDGISICELPNGPEKYYVYFKGIAIFFSYYIIEDSKK